MEDIRVRIRPAEAEVAMAEVTRRTFLKVAGAAGAAMLTGCKVVDDETGTPAVVESVTADSLVPAPTEILITPTGSLYTQSYGRLPTVTADDWRLRVHGLVSHERTLAMADIRAFPKVESIRTLECIGNPVGGNLIGNVRWGGCEAEALWREVGILAKATRARFEAEDDYQTSAELKWITQPGVLLIYEINGEPLAMGHGFPLRILMPGLYGQKMPKWIREIEFIDSDHQGYWESRGWSDIASVQTNSIVRQPGDLGRHSPGSRRSSGWPSRLARITAVEVRIDEGDWARADMLQDDSSLAWTQWSFDWAAVDGRHRIAVRATDDTGFVQTTESQSILSSAFPDGTDNIQSVVVTVLAVTAVRRFPAPIAGCAVCSGLAAAPRSRALKSGTPSASPVTPFLRSPITSGPGKPWPRWTARRSPISAARTMAWKPRSVASTAIAGTRAWFIA
jgi:DMSO/TMAO reductase YedYZ molybdopterin-dependent catalytic subunit